MQETKALISAMTGESRGGSRAAAPGCGFSRGATARSVSLAWGASNVVATMISSRAVSPRLALGVTALANVLGPFIFGVAVAETIGHEIVMAKAINSEVLLAALTGAVLWDLLTWYLGFPSSSSHALIGGFIGAVAVGAGWQAIQLKGLEKVLIALFFSPFIGFLIGYLILRLIVLLSWNA